jgi:hypothetical protein
MLLMQPNLGVNPSCFVLIVLLNRPAHNTSLIALFRNISPDHSFYFQTRIVIMLSRSGFLVAFFSVFNLTVVVAQNTATATSDIAQAAATARTLSPFSNVKGKAFDRFVVIWLENTNYDKASGDRKLIIPLTRWPFR